MMMIIIAALTWASLGLNRPLEIFLEVEQIGKLEGDDDDHSDEEDDLDNFDNHGNDNDQDHDYNTVGYQTTYFVVTIIFFEIYTSIKSFP